MKLGRIVKPFVLQMVNQIYSAPGRQRGQPVRPRSLRPAAGRNDPCPCGSGRKFKHCCRGR